MISDQFKARIEEECSRFWSVKIRINQLQRIYGGDISTCFKMETTGGDYFLKLHARPPAADMLRKEFSGLQALYRTHTVHVPRPLLSGAFGEYIYLITGFIHKDRPADDFWRHFAEELAALHRCTQNSFGWEEDNYIGTLPQPNRLHGGWADFYREERLYPLLRSAYEKKLFDHTLLLQAERLYNRLPDIFPAERPSLLHGDLWGGNFMVGPGGEAYVYDPSVYYGHREMDLGMSRLFGGFDRKFYLLYDEAYPLEKGWQQRIGICQLYPLLVHLHLFGGSYLSSIREILDSF